MQAERLSNYKRERRSINRSVNIASTGPDGSRRAKLMAEQQRPSPNGGAMTEDFTFGFASKPRPRWKLFAGSYVFEALLLLAVVNLAMRTPMVVVQAPHYDHITFLQPQPMKVAAQHRIAPPPPQLLRKIAPPVTHVEVPPPVETAKLEPKQPLPSKVETGRFDQPAAPKPAGNPYKQVETGKFSGSSAAPTLKAPIQKVQTGGFGDPNGVPAQNSPTKNGLQIAQVGSFDLPQGAGHGNGTGGNKGQPGTVKSAGFGPGVAGPGAGDHNGGGTRAVQQSGFGDVKSAAPGSGSPGRQGTVEAALQPVEILEKPKPSYTDEARKLRIEGEVLLQVVFGASGRIEVVRVVRGLGHGLDESAVRAAERIRYKPATRHGRAVDSPAVLHIVFQLA
jgi:TonB family protein